MIMMAIHLFVQTHYIVYLKQVNFITHKYLNKPGKHDNIKAIPQNKAKMELNVLNKTQGKETLLNESNYVLKWKKLKKLKLFLVITSFVVLLSLLLLRLCTVEEIGNYVAVLRTDFYIADRRY